MESDVRPSAAAEWEAPPTAGDTPSPAPPSQELLLREGARVGRYVIVEHIGRGGMGVVYWAYDRQLDRRVALKMVRGRPGPDHFDRLVKEAQALAKLSSPHVVTVHEVGEGDGDGRGAGQYFIAMEYVDGTTLAEWLRASPPWRSALRVFFEAGRGLADAHRAGIVHRDFKPANVLVARAGRAKVCDFGIAVVGGDEDEAPNLVGAPFVAGTPRYMSPELADGGRADVASDVYAFAVALAEALSDLDPDASRSTGLDAALRQARWKPGVPNRIKAVLRRALASDPARRYPSMDALLRDLEPGRDRRRAIAALTLVGGVAAVLGGASWWQAQRVSCASAKDPVARVWNLDERALVRRAFVGDGRPAYVAALADGVIARLDAYAAETSSGLVETCQASAIDKTLGASEADARRDCLLGRSAELGSLAAHLIEANEDALANAPFAVGGMSAVEECRDPRRTALTGPAPRDPAQRAAVQAIRAQLLDATEQTLRGHYEDAARVAEGATDAAWKIGYRPIQAEAERRLGMIDLRLGHYADAETSLRRAVVDADVARDDLLRAQVAIDLVGLADAAQAKLEQGLEWAPVAQAAIDRAGGDDSREAALQNHLGSVLWRLARYDESMQAFERSLALRRRLGEADEIPGTLNNEALVLWDTGELRRALDVVQEAEKAMGAIFGIAHPIYASVLENEGNLWLELGRPDKAIAALQRVADIRERALPERHPLRAQTFLSIGEALAATGDLDAADRTLERALAMIREAGGEPGSVAEFQRALGVNEHRRRRWQHAEELLRGALAGYVGAFGESHPEYAKTVVRLAALQVDTARLKDGEQAADRARAILEAAKGNERDVCAAWFVRAEARLAAADRQGGREALRRAAEALEPKRAEYPGAFALVKLRLFATDVALDPHGGAARSAELGAAEEVGDRTDVEAVFVRAYARALRETLARAGEPAHVDPALASATKELAEVAYVDPAAARELTAQGDVRQAGR